MSGLIRLDDANATLSGDLLTSTVVPLIDQGRKLVGSAGPRWTVDMAGVGRVSSVGVALLLDWLRAAEHEGVVFRIRNLPDHLRPIIAVSDLDDLIAPLCAGD